MANKLVTGTVLLVAVEEQHVTTAEANCDQDQLQEDHGSLDVEMVSNHGIHGEASGTYNDNWIARVLCPGVFLPTPPASCESRTSWIEAALLEQALCAAPRLTGSCEVKKPRHFVAEFGDVPLHVEGHPGHTVFPGQIFHRNTPGHPRSDPIVGFDRMVALMGTRKRRRLLRFFPSLAR